MKKVGRAIVNYIKATDKLLFFLCLGTSCFGVLIAYSIAVNFSTSFVNPERLYIVQGLALVLGVFAATFISTIDYHQMADLWKLHTALCWLLVILTFFIGYQRPGIDDKAWLLLPGGLMLQPSELLKISFIITFARQLSLAGDELNRPRRLLPILVHFAAAVGIIVLQGDDGTALVFIVIGIMMLLAAGISWKYVLAAGGAVAAALPLVWFFVLDNDKRNRFLTLLFPEMDPLGVGWQQSRSKIAIGSGKIFGKGLFADNLQKVPEMQNDFIFAYIGQVLGFAGCVLVVAVLVAICARVLRISMLSQDSLGRLICVGFFAVLSFQAIANIGMCLSVMPVIGITLPFLSGGGSSLLMMFMGIGVVLSVAIHNKQHLFIG